MKPRVSSFAGKSVLSGMASEDIATKPPMISRRRRSRVVAIIPAAGSGKRLGSREKKPFMSLGGKPLITYALKALNLSGYIDTIIIAAQASSIKRLKGIIKRYGINKARVVTKGGKTRAESVRNCFDLITEPCDIVLIHDAARPFPLKDMIKKTVLLAKRYGACITAIRQTDTVKLANKRLFVKRTLDRSSLWSAQTPQAFRYSLLKKAIESTVTGQDITDDASVLERIGKRVKILEGSARNIKITTKEDLKIAEALL
jgi:2-C-methyl-D-erythritol 4-phosphate cytidylyltransferase